MGWGKGGWWWGGKGLAGSRHTRTRREPVPTHTQRPMTRRWRRGRAPGARSARAAASFATAPVKSTRRSRGCASGLLRDSAPREGVLPRFGYRGSGPTRCAPPPQKKNRGGDAPPRMDYSAAAQRAAAARRAALESEISRLQSRSPPSSGGGPQQLSPLTYAARPRGAFAALPPAYTAVTGAPVPPSTTQPAWDAFVGACVGVGGRGLQLLLLLPHGVAGTRRAPPRTRPAKPHLRRAFHTHRRPHSQASITPPRLRLPQRPRHGWRRRLGQPPSSPG